MKPMVFTFGRFNPVSIGHEKLVRTVQQVAQNLGADWRIYASHTHDKKKNPLSYETKIKYLKQAFPFANKNIFVDTKGEVKTPFAVFYQLAEQGYQKAVMVVGEDRLPEFKNQWLEFQKKNPDELPNLEVQFVSAGHRDPDAEGVEGISASKLRDFASKGQLDSFTTGLPPALRPSAKRVYSDVRLGMQLESVLSFSEYIQK